MALGSVRKTPVPECQGFDCYSFNRTQLTAPTIVNINEIGHLSLIPQAQFGPNAL